MKLITYHKYILCILLAIPLHVGAADKTNADHAIDISLEQCLGDNYVKTHQVNCLGKAIDQWDVELNKSYKKLMSILNNNQKVIVRDSQRQWIVYRDMQIKAINVMYNGEWGTATLSRMSAIMGLTKDKAIELHGFVKNIENESY